MSLSFNFDMLFSIPIDSTSSLDSLIPAVSKRLITTPFRFILPSTMSLVVPFIFVTIALFSFKSAFNIEDLPTFGLPTIATLIPSLIMFPLMPSFTNFSIYLIFSLQISTIFSLFASSISKYSG